MYKMWRSLPRRAPGCFRSLFVHTPKHALITHKFYYGQGADLTLLLTNRTYKVTFETIWEDYTLLEIEGLTGAKDYVMEERGKECVLSDRELDPKLQEQIVVRLKIPEDMSYKAEVRGSISHQKGDIPSKLRSFHVVAKLLGDGGSFWAENLTSETLNIAANNISINQVLAGSSTFTCDKFECVKLSISKHVKISAKEAKIRSLILQDSEA